MTQRLTALFSMSLLLATAGLARANEAAPRVRIAAAYGGVLTNTYEDGRVALSGSGALGGLYLQWIEPDYFQTNLFVYYAPSVNESRVFGLHLNGDAYFFSGDWGSLVAGLDVEDLFVNMDAKDSIAGLSSFTLENNTLAIMGRAGVRVRFAPLEGLKLVVFPYVGVMHQRDTGEITRDPLGDPDFDPPAVTSSIEESQNSFAGGLNLTAKVGHLGEVTLKYLGHLDEDELRSIYTAELKVFVHRSAVVSYQFKDMEMSFGSNRYHLLGAGYVF